MQINSIVPGLASVSQAAGADAATSAAQTSPTGKSFGQVLEGAISEVNDSQLKAYDVASQFAAGAPMDVHQVMIATQEASVTLSLASQVRNKVMDAYSELMHVTA